MKLTVNRSITKSLEVASASAVEIEGSIDVDLKRGGQGREKRFNFLLANFVGRYFYILVEEREELLFELEGFVGEEGSLPPEYLPLFTFFMAHISDLLDDLWERKESVGSSRFDFEGEEKELDPTILDLLEIILDD